MPVMTPTGSSSGDMTTLAITSHRTKNAAPARNELIRSILWSGPAIMRMKWGTIRPANIMMPATDTLNPVKTHISRALVIVFLI